MRHDGGINLHTRSDKYGQLDLGQIVEVSANLVHRQRHHFHTLQQLGLTLIFGCNGMIWIAPTGPSIEVEQCQSASRVANAIRCLSRLRLPIFLATVMSVVHLSLDSNVAIQDMGRPEFLTMIVRKEAERRQSTTA